MTENAAVAQQTGRNWDLGFYAKLAAFGALYTTILNVAVFYISKNALGLNLLVAEGPDTTSLVALQSFQVVVSGIVPAFGAAILFSWLQKITSKAVPIFLFLSLGIFAVSFYPVVNFAMDADSTRYVFAIMHVVAAVFIVGALLRGNNQKG